MKKIVFALLAFVCYEVHAQKLVMNDETTDVSFTTKFLAGRLTGTFKGVNGSAEFNPAELKTSYLKLAFAVATVSTSDNTFGPNLIQPACFYPNKYPYIELFSTSITKSLSDSTFNFNGQLKIKGITKNVTIPFKAIANEGGYDFYFAFSFRRKTFHLNCLGTGTHFKVNVRAYAKRM